MEVAEEERMEVDSGASESQSVTSSVKRGLKAKGSSSFDRQKCVLIDFLLEIEDAVFSRRLGSVNCGVDREAWRSALGNKGDTVRFTDTSILVQGSKVANGIILISLDSLKNSDLSSVQRLGVALLQLSQGLKWGCLQEPFVVEKEGGFNCNTYMDWQKAILKCGSISALALFAKTLDRSINWEWTPPRPTLAKPVPKPVGVPVRARSMNVQTRAPVQQLITHYPRELRYGGVNQKYNPPLTARQRAKAEKEAAAMKTQERAVPRYVPAKKDDSSQWSTFTEVLNRGRVSQIKHIQKPQQLQRPQQQQFERGRPATREDEDEGARNQRPKRAASVTATEMIRSFGKSGGM